MIQEVKKELDAERKDIQNLRESFIARIDTLKQDIRYLKEMLMSQEGMIDNVDDYIDRLEVEINKLRQF